MSLQAPNLPEMLDFVPSARSRVQLVWPRAVEALALVASLLGVATFVLR